MIKLWVIDELGEVQEVDSYGEVSYEVKNPSCDYWTGGKLGQDVFMTEAEARAVKAAR